MQKSTAVQLLFSSLGRLQVLGEFCGGDLSSDGGIMLLREVDRVIALTERVAACFTDYRNPNSVIHGLLELIRQRVYALCQGYEDLNDHRRLRTDPALMLALEHLGQGPLASAPTLNRLELSRPGKAAGDRYRRIEADFAALEDLLIDLFLEAYPEPPARIVIDVDATDFELHGKQQYRRFHGYYDGYVYLPIYVLCGEHLLCCHLRSAARAPGSNCLLYLVPALEKIRAAWPDTRIVLRADADYARDDLMDWCEHKGIFYVIGAAQNPYLRSKIADLSERSLRRCLATGKPSRRFRSFAHETKTGTWTRPRRVVGKAEYLPSNQEGRGPRRNSRFVVTNLGPELINARDLYELEYCPRGNCEQRIFEQLQLFADRASSHYFQANQLRLYFSGFAYTLLSGLRRLGIDEADAPEPEAIGAVPARRRREKAAEPVASESLAPRPLCGTIRERYLKVAVRIRRTTRRIYLEFASAYPYREEFGAILQRLVQAPVLARAPVG